jgi:hypothetical protein
MISVEEENREKRNPEQNRKVSLVNRKTDENIESHLVLEQ